MGLQRLCMAPMPNSNDWTNGQQASKALTGLGGAKAVTAVPAAATTPKTVLTLLLLPTGRNAIGLPNALRPAGSTGAQKNVCSMHI